MTRDPSRDRDPLAEARRSERVDLGVIAFVVAMLTTAAIKAGP